MSTGLTKRQRALLDFVRDFSKREGQPPSYEQMAAGVGLRSKSGAFRLLASLEERGAIRRLPNRSRSIEVVESCPRFTAAVESNIAAYCRRHRVEREAAVSRAVEAFFGSAA